MHPSIPQNYTLCQHKKRERFSSPFLLAKPRLASPRHAPPCLSPPSLAGPRRATPGQAFPCLDSTNSPIAFDGYERNNFAMPRRAKPRPAQPRLALPRRTVPCLVKPYRYSQLSITNLPNTPRYVPNPIARPPRAKAVLSSVSSTSSFLNRPI